MAQGTTKGVPIDVDPTLAADSDLLVPSQKAIKSYVDNNFLNPSDLSATTPLTYSSSTGVFTINQASSSANGYLTSTDWTTFNGKQDAISLTTTGTSGAATLVGSTLNIPQYTAPGSTQIWGFQLANVIAAATTTWVGIGQIAGSTENVSTVIIPVACTLSDMYTMHYSTAQPATGSQVFMVRKNGVDTALTITIAAGSAPTTTPYSLLGVSVSFTVGDKLAVRRVNNAATTGGAVNGLSFKMVI